MVMDQNIFSFPSDISRCIERFNKIRGGSRAAATSKMECFLIIVNGFQRLLGCCSSPRSTSENYLKLLNIFVVN